MTDTADSTRPDDNTGAADPAVIAATTPQRAHRHRRARMTRRRRRAFVALLVVGAALVVFGPRLSFMAIAHDDVASKPGDLRALPTGDGPRVALVLGAGVRADGSPTPILADRIDGAVQLHDRGDVDLIVMSADNQHPDYDEPTAMRARAIDAGVPATDIVSDYAGRRTWDSCVRAHDVFGVRDVIVVTSSFHAARAQVSCDRAGIDTRVYAIGESRFSTKSQATWHARELLASGRALGDLLRRPDSAVAGEPVDLTDPCARWSSLSAEDPNRGRSLCRTR